MAVSRKPKDPFSAFRPQKSDVPIGNGVFALQTSTLDQESRFLAVLERLDLDKLFGPLGQLMEGFLSEESEGKGGMSTLAVIPKIAELGPEIWKAAQTVLGRQFAPAIRDASIALLDTRQNLEAMLGLELIEDIEPDVGESGEYLGCAGVRAFIAENLTMRQAINVVRTAWTINGYGEVLGNLMPLMQQEPVAQGKTG